MKKSLLTLLAFVGIVFSGCVQVDILEPALKMHTITVSAGMGIDTKAGVSDSGTFTWYANDAISVLGTDGLYYTLSLTAGAGTKNAEFSGSIPEGVSITTVATYPAIVENGASSTIYDSESKVLNFTLPAEYTYEEGYANVPMVATFEAGAESLSFKHIGALVRIPLNGMPANAKVCVSATNRKVTGEFALATDKVGLAEGVISTITGTTGNTVTVNYPSEVSGQTAEINLPLPVGTYESLSVSVKDAADEEVFSKTWDFSSITFGRANILVLDAEQVGPIGISEVYPFFVDARVIWAKAKDVENYALYVDDAEPVIVSVAELKEDGNMLSYMIGGDFGHKTTHTVAVAPVINNVPAVELKSEAFEFTTGDVMQITYNTGTKFICAGWDDVAVGPEYGTYFSNGKWNKIIEVAGKSDHSVRAYQIQLYKEDKTTLLYDEIPFDGQESGMSPFISGNYWGRIASASCLYPTSLSLGWLEPDTKYYFRVRTLAESVVMNSDNGNFKDKITLKSARGGSAWSDFVEMKTDAEYVMSDWDVLYEGFDDMLYNSDIGNMSAAAVPLLRTTNSLAYKERHEGQLSKWIKKDLANREFSEQEVNVFLSPYQLGLTDDSYTDATPVRTFNALAGSLEGWSVLSGKTDYDAYPDFGLLRIGQNINSKAGCAEIRTAPIASDKLSADKEKACFVTIHVSPAQGTYIIPKKKVIISQYRNGEIIVQKTINDYTLNADGTLRQEWVDNYVEESRQNYERTPIWFEVVTETFNLMNGDMISISTDSVDRGFVMLSDIKITIDKDADYDSDENETRFYGTAPDNTNYDIWGMNGVMPVTFWMGPPALDQFNADAITAAELANLKATYFDPIVQGGYNLIEISNPYPSSMNVLLQWCADAGVKMIDKSIGDWTNTQANVDRITQYANNTAFAGLFVGRDEPAVSDYSIISQMNAAFKSSLPTKTRTVNLFPDYANSSQLGVSTYENYVSTFVNQIDMSDGKFNFMYDHYCLKKSDNFGNASRGLVNSTQYHNLDIVRHYSLEKRLPFIQITHGRPQWDPGYSATIANNDPAWRTDVSATALPPKPDEHVYDEQRWLVWSQLALGSKGVSYFCYWTPAAFKGGPFSFHVDGTKTRMYDILKNINTEIQPIGKILMTCHADGAMSTNPVNKFVMFENGGGGLLNYGPVLDLNKEGDENVIAGCFRDASTGEYKVLITHMRPAMNDTEAATPSIANLTIDTSMASSVKLHTVTLIEHNAAATTVESTKDVSSGMLTLSIPDGTAVLVEFPETANVNYN